MQFSVTILGSNSALPTSERFPTAQVLNASERFFLIDCGEGTQLQLRRNKIRFNRINHIFISHLHGDHCFGLIGLISTFSLLGRKPDLHIYGHADLHKVFKPQIDYFCRDISFKVVFHAIDPHQQEIIYDDDKISVETIPMKHRIPTCGFLFREKPRDKHVIRDMLDFYQVPLKSIALIKKGEDFTTIEGEVVPNEKLTKPAAPPRSYAFCSDTAYNEKIIDQIRGVDLMYHEATFLDDKESLAKSTFHSTAKQAALLALKAEVKKLIIGHFSTRYFDLDPFQQQAQSVFPNTQLAKEGRVFEIPYIPNL
ncbi:ribonuclease Z [Natronoflexus pectinivorans]|uniref:Ribonuclease Z n=1 Tax=Natronoflexus pectinivorans TaxID=682526 RepID=A0A4R2GDI7_9BACT|nr:ribonuclease Z [Natronoflexus pectinivorans]TCO05960.1 ribonuclease Z [Natronoflexus pectinivorans]